VDGRPVTESVVWIGGLDLALDLRLDAFGLVMTALVSGIGLLVFVYSVGYFAHIRPGQARLAGFMTLFAGSMLGVVWADHLIALFVAWELTSITSYLLIGNDDRDPRARAAALQAMFTTGAGGLALLAGFVIVGQSAGTYRISALLESPPSGTAVSAAVVCILVGAFTKSAQAPFGSWLPGAMVAPTPVSAYLHSATMVKAGVYLVARLTPIFVTTGHWRLLVLVVGSVTMVIGGLRALRQHDLKLLLAYGTISQLGFMMLLFGTGEYEIAEAGVVLLLAHGAFKAALFMVVGIVDHEAGTRDVRRLHGFGSDWTAVKVAAVVGAASMAGLPPLLGFIAKEKALEGYLDAGDFTGATVVLVVIVAASMLTFAYSARCALGVLGRLGDPDEEVVSRDAHPPDAAFLAPALVLTAFTLVAGLAPVVIDQLVVAATEALEPGSDPSHLHLWAGFTAAFALSLVIIAVGTALTVGRRPVERFQLASHRALRRVPSAEQGYEAVIRAITRISQRVTGVTQSGSLPLYLLVIVSTAVIVPVAPMLGELDAWPEWVERWIHVPLVAIIVGAALGAALVKRRIAAAVMLGAVGFAMAGLYESLGAPDLALTQFAIETLGTVIFVLVLRFLPSRFVDVAPAVLRPVRLAVSAVVAAAVFVFALVASDARSDVARPSVSEEMVARAEPDGHGKNVVNVILVDFRGADTMGEITVLVVAAVGAVGLARVGRGRRGAVPTSGRGPGADGAATADDVADDGAAEDDVAEVLG
jgi:multicomponent Na+:H+ antiporter subunit A